MNTRVDQKDPVLYYCLYGIIAVGVFVTLRQYFFNRSLWVDEASLALNILGRSFWELLQPLTYNQAAPIGFLFVEKLFTIVFGNSEYALRLFPLLCHLASIPMFYLLSKALMKDTLGGLLSVSFYSATPVFIYFASEVKQYTSDVLMTMILVWMTVIVRDKHMKYLTVYALVGSIAIWFSNVAIMVLFACGLFLLISEVFQHRRYLLLAVFAAWATSFLVYYVLFIHDHPTEAYMKTFWANNFLPMNAQPQEMYAFIQRRIFTMFREYLEFDQFAKYARVVFCIGLLIAAYKKTWPLIYFSLVLFVIHLFISGLELYPYSGRFILYLIPMFILPYIYGFYSLFKVMQSQLTDLPQIMLVFPVIFILIPLSIAYPRERENIKASIAFIETNRQPEESVYVNYAGCRALTYYQRTEKTTLNDATTVCLKRTPNPLEHEEVLSNLRGKIWLLFSSIYPSTSGNEEYRITNYLLRNGSTIIEQHKAVGSSCYYIDTGKSSSGE